MYVALSKMKKAVSVVVVVISLCFQRTYSVQHNAAVGDDVLIPCGIHATGVVTRLVWKIGLNTIGSQQLAFIAAGTNACDTTKKNCTLTDNGDLVLYNVQETDSNVHYFCYLNDETYYAEHTLNVYPKELPPTFEDCPKAINVSACKLEQSSQMVLLYTPPVCRNSRDVFGRVNCDPSSGARIDSNHTKIVCSCTHSVHQSDTCEIPIPATYLIELNCAKVTAGGFFLGFFVMVIAIIIN